MPADVDLLSTEVDVFAADCASLMAAPHHISSRRSHGIEAADLMAVVVLLEEEALAVVSVVTFFFAILECNVVVV